MANARDIFQLLLNDFEKVVGHSYMPIKEYVQLTEKLIEFCDFEVSSQKVRKTACIFAINQKLELNKENIKALIDFAASQKIYFNYHDKKSIKDYFDSLNEKEFIKFLDEKIKNKEIVIGCKKLFCPINTDKTIEKLGLIAKESGHQQEILNSLFAAYVFNSFPISLTHGFFSDNNSNNYIPDYYEYLHNCFGHSLKREKAITLLVISESLIESFDSLEEFKDSLCNYIRYAYDTLSNHCHLAIYIDLGSEYVGLKWELYSDIVLYAEKFNEEKLKIGYFHPKRIEEQTLKHIPNLNINDSDFKIANGGFTYKDCFILTETDFRDSKVQEEFDNYGMLLMFEKNHRDETLIPCPACRSKNVRGNSYPVIGVKSWECNNLLCPDKSKFDRGKRYSLSSLIKQEAIFYEDNEIKNGTIKKWQLDLLKKLTKEEIVEFLVKHYSLINDTIEIVDYSPKLKNTDKRNFVFIPFRHTNDNSLKRFYESAFFRRFEIVDESNGKEVVTNISPLENHTIYNGDSRLIMKSMRPNSISHAVTSPPYYNAKEYSNWDNIYCYLFDMFNNAQAVFRVLKPGGTYLFNIFDYFDNENNLVFSAMGKKRMILGAYIIRLFKQAGFKLVKNVIWYKGHIQGNRSFNQGNNFPYYQAPLNCYEHVFQFVKPSNDAPMSLPDIVHIKPVYKIVKGENILGHTAPFPKGIPYLIAKKLSNNECILDPYSGSFTTARAAADFGVKSVSIEYDKEYCQLGLKLLKLELSNSPALFK
jgi:DNA modification methylase